MEEEKDGRKKCRFGCATSWEGQEWPYEVMFCLSYFFPLLSFKILLIWFFIYFSGRELFLSNASLFVDDAEAFEEYHREEEAESNEQKVIGLLSKYCASFGGFDFSSSWHLVQEKLCRIAYLHSYIVVSLAWNFRVRMNQLHQDQAIPVVQWLIPKRSFLMTMMTTNWTWMS